MIHPTVPERYLGVWMRTLLRTPEAEDRSTFVRWLQGPGWHADLRVPARARPADRPATALELAAQQGFCGFTEVSTPPEGETCAWRRQLDFQPPAATPDEGRIRWEGPDRLIETGVHGDYLEIWERVPGSQGRHIALLSGPEPAATRLFVAGDWMMRVRPRRSAWPADLPPGTSLATLGAAHPALLPAWLDFEISWGPLQAGHWQIERSTLPALEGQTLPLDLQRTSDDTALCRLGQDQATPWRILEWAGPAP